MTNENIQTTLFSGIQKKSALLVAACVAVAVFALAWLICSLQYETRKNAVLQSHQESMQSWVNGTVNAVDLWVENLEAQAKRVSGSGTYRLFGTELSQMDDRTTTLINEMDTGIEVPDSAFSLAEEVPHIRNTLLEFMNFSGLLDARIVSPQGQTLLSALSRPTPITPEQRQAVAKAVETARMAFAPVRASKSGLVVDAADPLLAVMSADGSEKPVAAVLITTPVTGQIAQFLARDLRQSFLRPHILQNHNGLWEEVQVHSPVPVPLDADIAKSLSLKEDGSLPFGLRPGLDGRTEVYSLGSKVSEMDWWVILEVPADVVHGELKTLGWMIFGIGALISLGVVLGLALLWWVLVGHQQRIIAQRFENLYTLINRQKTLLDSVNVSLNVGLFMADINGNIEIGNRAFAGIARVDEDKLNESTLSSLFDGRVSGQLLDHIREVAVGDDSATFELGLPQADGEHLYRVTMFPFEDTTDHGAKGAVAIMQDITEFRRNSEKCRLQQMHTLDAFVRAIEGVDPYLTGHSRKMSVLGDLIAKRMSLGEQDRSTITMAANLSQVGKLFVPRDLLTKTGKLTPEEQAEMTKVPEHAYRVLKDIDFELPVPDAIYEMYERMDGTGYPKRLKGNEISVHARILAVVNAFCAMVSPRSYRSGMPVDEAIASLRNNKASFDTQIVDILDEVLRTTAGAQALLQATDKE